jgi:hypothetical protein
VQEGPWVDLFNGTSLDGWSVRGGAAEFRVEEGQIVGMTKPNTPNSFLVSNREFADFELLLDFKVHPELNSGIQIRSAVDGGFDNRAGRLIGYQVEIDPSARSYTGGIYDEARRGWLYALIDNPAARGALKPNDWNQFRIRAFGPRVQTWLNGVPAADLFDAADSSGRIALQVHGVGERADPLEVRFRNIRIRELSRGTSTP